MSVSIFFEKTKVQIKNAVSAHPIEIFLISAFAIGIWFVDMNSGKDHLAYWLFEPMLFAFIYLSRPYSWYRFSWIVPLIAVFTIWQVNDNADFYGYSPKFWGAQFIVLLILFGFPFVRNNQAFTYRNFTTLYYITSSIAGWGLVSGLVAAILASISTLFNIDFSEWFQKHLYSSITAFCLPLFFLVFQQRQENTEMTLNRSFDILVNFILAPALMIFTALLYAYVGKIILAGALPKGMVSNIALPYLVGGLGVYALRSISVKANWDSFFKFFPYLSIVPIVLLWLAIDRRISAYAWTEQRIYLVALASAITVAYAILIIPKIRQYRLISVVVMIAIFAMTWVVKPKEIAYQSQTERFEQLLTKLNLSDNSGKIRDDVDFLSRLENMPENERQDWNELDDVSDYLVYHFDSAPYKGLNYEEKQKAFVQKYGEKSNELISLDVYDHSFRINDREIMAMQNSPIREAEFEWSSIDVSSYKKWIHVPVYQFYRVDDNSSKKEENEPKKQAEVCFVEDHNRYCTNMDQHIKKVFQQHHLDAMKKLAESDLKLIRKDLLKIDAPGFAIYLGSLEMQFSQEKGYYYKELTVEAIFDK
ncbi:DUF4153 domain-containing protein [uncultured Haemophilus sp.]|uniref:DUF4153 domain-containing protein n=1 Tax=uncultured Haemophilus sp. TaxID=237779 RepID=UPI0027DDD5A0|nr:DUF4153 domain-containing protein [uncultured Haemophilus sp.]